jgi:hypothetical protein
VEICKNRVGLTESIKWILEGNNDGWEILVCDFLNCMNFCLNKNSNIMATRREIQCINKINRTDPTESITHVGGTSPNRWKHTVSEVMSLMSNDWEFYVIKNGREVKVIKAKSRYGNDYIKTEADSYEPNNLLSLPECP